MRARALLVALVAALSASSVLASAAGAAPWTRVTGPTGTAADQVALLRTGDGVLHVVWRLQTAPFAWSLSHTALAPDGAVGPATAIAAEWSSIEDPALVAVPGGIQAFWGGALTEHPDEPNREMNVAGSVDGGATWVLNPGPVVAPGSRADDEPVAATTQADGTVVQAWTAPASTFVHQGINPAIGNTDVQGPLGGDGMRPALATDATGMVVLAWVSRSEARAGVVAQVLSASGTAAGAPLAMPGSSGAPAGDGPRTALAARAGGGFVVAAPTGDAQDRVRVWPVGAKAAPVIARTSGRSRVAIAAAADGRLWLAWTSRVNGRTQSFARRSNRRGTVWGAPVLAGRPDGASSSSSLDASVAGGALDLLGAWASGATSSTWATRVLPGLSVSVGRRGANARAVVTDAGSPVAGARVVLRGRSARSNDRGVALVRVSGGGRVAVTAPGYAPATVSLR